MGGTFSKMCQAPTNPSHGPSEGYETDHPDGEGEGHHTFAGGDGGHYYPTNEPNGHQILTNLERRPSSTTSHVLHNDGGAGDCASDLGWLKSGPPPGYGQVNVTQSTFHGDHHHRHHHHEHHHSSCHRPSFLMNHRGRYFHEHRPYDNPWYQTLKSSTSSGNYKPYLYDQSMASSYPNYGQQCPSAITSLYNSYQPPPAPTYLRPPPTFLPDEPPSFNDIALAYNISPHDHQLFETFTPPLEPSSPPVVEPGAMSVSNVHEPVPTSAAPEAAEPMDEVNDSNCVELVDAGTETKVGNKLANEVQKATSTASEATLKSSAEKKKQKDGPNMSKRFGHLIVSIPSNVCKTCNKEFESPSKLFSHPTCSGTPVHGQDKNGTKYCIKQAPYRCLFDGCIKTYSECDKLTRHVRRSHFPPIWQCFVCHNFTHKSRKVVKDHADGHRNDENNDSNNNHFVGRKMSVPTILVDKLDDAVLDIFHCKSVTKIEKEVIDEHVDEVIEAVVKGHLVDSTDKDIDTTDADKNGGGDAELCPPSPKCARHMPVTSWPAKNRAPTVPTPAPTVSTPLPTLKRSSPTVTDPKSCPLRHKVFGPSPAPEINRPVAPTSGQQPKPRITDVFMGHDGQYQHASQHDHDYGHQELEPFVPASSQDDFSGAISSAMNVVDQWDNSQNSFYIWTPGHGQSLRVPPKSGSTSGGHVKNEAIKIEPPAAGGQNGHKSGAGQSSGAEHFDMSNDSSIFTSSTNKSSDVLTNYSDY